MENIDYKDFENICRTCLLNCGVNFTQDSVIVDIFYKLTGLNFETNDLPQQICLKCFETINEIHTFAFLCKRTHAALIECLNKHKGAEIKTEIDVEEEELAPQMEIVEFDDTTTPTDNFEIVVKEETNTPIAEEQKDPLRKPEKKFTCELCNKKFVRLKSYKNHKIVHKRNPYNCTKCPSIFPRLTALNSHQKRHRGEAHHKCPKCSKSYFFLSGLRNHVCLEDKERSYKCGKCSMSFKNEDSLRMHEVDGDDHVYKCNQCSMSFVKLVAWNSHMNTHISEKSFKCELCNQSFSLSSTLKVHMYSHDHEHPT